MSDYWWSQRVLDAMFGTSATCTPEQPITADEPSFTVERKVRLLAAGMIWDEGAEDWIPDPAVWGDHGPL